MDLLVSPSIEVFSGLEHEEVVQALIKNKQHKRLIIVRISHSPFFYLKHANSGPNQKTILSAFLFTASYNNQSYPPPVS